MKKFAAVALAASLLLAACGGGNEEVLEAPAATEPAETVATEAPATPAPGEAHECADYLELPAEFVVAKSLEFAGSCSISGHLAGDRVDEMADALESILTARAADLERSEATIDDARTVTLFGATEDDSFVSASVSLQPSFEGGEGLVENVTVVNVG